MRKRFNHQLILFMLAVLILVVCIVLAAYASKRLESAISVEEAAARSIAESYCDMKRLGDDAMELCRLWMWRCCAGGDMETGLSVQGIRDALIEAYDLEHPHVDFRNFYYLSRIISLEAGCHTLSQEWRMCVGEVVLNRMESDEYPDDIADVLYQPGQYYDCTLERYTPAWNCMESAWRLVCGERVLNDKSVVFQANFIQGSGPVVIAFDRQLGYTYFCYALNLDRYAESGFPEVRELADVSVGSE